MARILVVDDEIRAAEILQEFLSAKGYEVQTAADGREAVEKVKKMKPHIVLLDIIMPGMDGIDTLKKIMEVDPDTGVIMATAVADVKTAEKAFQLGARDFITKPFDLNLIESVVMNNVTQPKR